MENQASVWMALTARSAASEPWKGGSDRDHLTPATAVSLNWTSAVVRAGLGLAAVAGTAAFNRRDLASA